MAWKGNTVSLVIISASVIMIGWLIHQPLLPLRRETKQYLGHSEDSLLNFTELTAKYGYPTEEHMVTTADGYLLTLFRITGRNCTEKRTPVLLMHGILQTSACWIISGPKSALAYQIADQCHDLWLGNIRGNYYSRRHITLNPDKDLEFWHFSVNELARYDTPALIDHILNHTGHQKLNYIGYSLGSGMYFAMCSELPHYCNKANVLIGLAPAFRLINLESPGFKLMFNVAAALEGLLTKFEVGEVLSKGSVSQEITSILCQASPLFWNVCEWVRTKIDSEHYGSITDETLQAFYGHFPGGTSVRLLVRCSQGLASEYVQDYDFGPEGNLVHYGSVEPMRYNLSAVSLPTVVMYGASDMLVTPADVKWLMTQLPNVLEEIVVADPKWNHIDFAYSRNANEQIFPKINEYLEKFS